MRPSTLAERMRKLRVRIDRLEEKEERLRDKKGLLINKLNDLEILAEQMRQEIAAIQKPLVR